MKSLVKLVEEKILNDILMANLLAGSYLDSERKLAETYQVSRPVIHQAIIRLEEQGLVEIKPRQGILVKDFTEEGKISLLNSIQELNRQEIDQDLNMEMLIFIKENLKIIISSQVVFSEIDIDLLEKSDFYKLFHKLAGHTNNRVYKMLINEFKVGIENVAKYSLREEKIIQGLNEMLVLIRQKKLNEANIMLEAVFELIKVVWIGGLDES